jgi:hypothetical protein
VLKFGVIAEGSSDQQVIENILLGYFQNEEEEPDIRPFQPPRATTGLPAPPGGWTLVFRCLARGDFQQALNFNDFLVIHIDTDVQEDPGFDVPRRESGIELSVPERVDRVIARLIAVIGEELFQTKKDRILFAVAVDSIECWLLPLLHSDKKKAEKTTGCLKTANAAIRKTNKKGGLSSGDTKKFPEAYEQASREYTKRKKLMEHRDRNPSLELFIKQLDALQNRLAANHPGSN